MRKLLALLLCAAFVLLCAACGIPAVDPDRVSVVATLFPQYDIARSIAGDRADVTLLLDFGVDAHSYDPTPADLVRIARADLFIYTGDGMEMWAAKLLQSADVQKAIKSGSLSVLDLSQHAELVCTHGHAHDHSEHDHGEYDPHIWTSIGNAERMSLAIADALAAIDASGREEYRVNCKAYCASLHSLAAEYRMLSPRLDTGYFGGSFAFAYLFDELGLHHMSVFEGCASHAEASAGDISAIVTAMRESGAKYVLYDSPAEEKIARTVAAETGAELLRLHAIHNISKAEFDAGETYFSLMAANLETLRKALN